MNESPAVALLLLTSGAIVGTYLWRGAGVMFAARIKSDSPVFQWVTFVSYAMLGGLIARMVILPIGPLMETPLLCRALAFVIGVGVFFGGGKRVLPAVFVGVATFILLVSFF